MPRPARVLALALVVVVPTLAFLGALEGVTRLVGGSTYTNLGLPEESSGIVQSDEELLWSLRPGFRGSLAGTPVRVNAEGLRGAEIPEKHPGEIRILSLGESTTFGSNVEEDQTYSAVLERLLTAGRSESVRVINAGVFAYSSAQSLRYLTTRGLKLDPDVVLLYHELNDYLPSTVRDSGSGTIGIMMTDQQIAASDLLRLTRSLRRHSAFYRLLHDAWQRYRISSFEAENLGNPLASIGLPRVGVPPRLRDAGEGLEVLERSLGRRVSETEREAILGQFLSECRQRGIALVVIHPSYRKSQPHECLTTRFCRAQGVPMFEAQPSLHAETLTSEELFTDAWHPTVLGHRRLGENLYAFLVAEGIVARPDGEESHDAAP